MPSCRASSSAPGRATRPGRCPACRGRRPLRCRSGHRRCRSRRRSSRAGFGVAEGKARTAQQPGQAHDRPWRGPGALVTAHRCLHATLGVPAHRQAPSTSASWSAAEASQTAVSAALPKSAQANRQAANRRPTPCNQPAATDTRRQQTPRSAARSKHCAWSRSGDACVHTAEATGRETLLTSLRPPSAGPDTRSVLTGYRLQAYVRRFSSLLP